jgi:hypothetical protein
VKIMKTLRIILLLLFGAYSNVICGNSKQISDDTLHRIDHETMDFGKVVLGTASSSKNFTITNKDTKGFAVKSSVITSNEDSIFTSNQPSSFELQKNSIKNVEIILHPDRAKLLGKRYSYYRLYYLHDNNDKDSLNLLITVEFIEDTVKHEITVSIPSMSKKTGEHFDLPIILDKISGISNLSKFTISISFNSSILVPIDTLSNSEIKYGIIKTYITREFQKTPKPGDTLAKILMAVTLGDIVGDSIYINGSAWFYNGKIINVSSKYKNGFLEISDIFYENNYPRLITKIIDTLNIEIPQYISNTNNTAIISYTNRANLIVYNLMGGLVSDLSQSLPLHTGYTGVAVPLNLNLFNKNSIYIIRLSNGQGFISRMFIVE